MCSLATKFLPWTIIKIQLSFLAILFVAIVMKIEFLNTSGTYIDKNKILGIVTETTLFIFLTNWKGPIIIINNICPVILGYEEEPEIVCLDPLVRLGLMPDMVTDGPE